MESKRLKKLPFKGERLGWTPLNQVRSVVLTTELMKGRKVTAHFRDARNEQSDSVSYLIP